MSARSDGFESPGKAILVPFAYFFGEVKNLSSSAKFHSPLTLCSASEYANSVPDAMSRPITSHKFGPILDAWPSAKVWQAIHFLLIFLPDALSAVESNTSKFGPGLG